MDHDEKKLKEAFNKYLKEQSESNFMDVLQLMRDTDVWIPCVAVLSENDQKKWEEVVQKAGDDVESLVGMSLSTEDAVRLVPDVLQNENGYFFPVFTSPNEMGDYGDGLSKTQNAFLEAVTLAKNNEKNVSGIVVNPFTDALVLDRQLFDVFEHLDFEDPEEDEELVNTLMGEWAYEQFTAIPHPGDSFRYHDLVVTVTEMEHNRILKLRVSRVPAEEEGGEEA